MGWTTARTWVTGELVSNSLMNTHVRDNLSYLYTSLVLGDQLQNRDASVSDVNNTTTPTAVYSYTIAGGTLGVNGVVRLSLVGDYLNNTGATRNLTLAVTYGATTIFTGTRSSAASGANRGGQAVDAVILVSAYGTQHSYAIWQHSETADNNAGGTGDGPTQTLVAAYNDVEEDTTTDTDLVVTVTHSAASANLSFRCHGVRLEVFPPFV